LGFIAAPGQDCLQASSQLTPGQQYAPAARKAFQANIGSQANDFPIVTAARVRFAQAKYVIYL
jgi:hypothetical protein